MRVATFSREIHKRTISIVPLIKVVFCFFLDIMKSSFPYMAALSFKVYPTVSEALSAVINGTSDYALLPSVCNNACVACYMHELF